jgi:hypothetical protein
MNVFSLYLVIVIGTEKLNEKSDFSGLGAFRWFLGEHAGRAVDLEFRLG